MRRGTFHYDIRARCTIEEAAALMADVPRLTSRHPLAIGTEELEPRDGSLRSTAVTSRLKLGPFSFLITYQADVMKVGTDEVVTIARQRPRTTLVNRARFGTSEDGLTHISVDIDYESPTPLFSYGFAKAQYAHRGLAQGIKEMLER